MNKKQVEERNYRDCVDCVAWYLHEVSSHQKEEWQQCSCHTRGYYRHRARKILNIIKMIKGNTKIMNDMYIYCKTLHPTIQEIIKRRNKR